MLRRTRRVVIYTLRLGHVDRLIDPDRIGILQPPSENKARPTCCVVIRVLGGRFFQEDNTEWNSFCHYAHQLLCRKLWGVAALKRFYHVVAYGRFVVRHISSYGEYQCRHICSLCQGIFTDLLLTCTLTS